MNSLVEHELPGMNALREQMLDLLSDADLAYRLPGNNLTLGELCAEMGYIQQVYTDSFRTLSQNWEHRDSHPETPLSVAGLRAWYHTLDADLLAALEPLSDDDLRARIVNRGDFQVSSRVQFEIYHEAVLIFYAKASIYLKALEKPYTGQWISWIG